jgi:hypothetical protein
MASVQNCSLLQKDSTDEPNGLHALLDRAECVLPGHGGLAARGARIAWVSMLIVGYFDDGEAW